MRKIFKCLAKYKEILIFIFSLALIAYIFQIVGIDSITSFIESLGVFGPIIFILIHALSIVAAPLEGSVFMFVSGSLFGFLPGSLYVIIAGILGGSINFWLARRLGRKFLENRLSKESREKIDKYSDIVSNRPYLLIPLMLTGLFDILGYACGLSRIRYRSFLIAVSVSSLSVPFYVYFGEQALSFDFIGWLFG